MLEVLNEVFKLLKEKEMKEVFKNTLEEIQTLIKQVENLEIQSRSELDIIVLLAEELRQEILNKQENNIFVETFNSKQMELNNDRYIKVIMLACDTNLVDIETNTSRVSNINYTNLAYLAEMLLDMGL